MRHEMRFNITIQKLFGILRLNVFCKNGDIKQNYRSINT